MKVLFMLCIFGVSFQNDSNSPYDEIIMQLNDVHQRWLDMNSISEVVHLSKFPPDSYRTRSGFSPINISEVLNNETTNIFDYAQSSVVTEKNLHKCRNDVLRIIINLKSQWALKMLDSDGKLSSSVLLGSLTWPGNYRECKSVHSPVEHGDFYGKYCMFAWTVKLPGDFPELSLNTGICVPDSCDESEIMSASKIISSILNRLPLLNKYTSYLTLESVSCKQDVNTLDAAAVIYIFILASFILMVVLGTFTTIFLRLTAVEQISPLDVLQSHGSTCGSDDSFKRPCAETESCTTSTDDAEKIIIKSHSNTKNSFASELIEVLQCFCAITNGNKILSTDVQSGQLLSLHGIRFLSLTWVIIGHTYISAVSVIGNRLQVLEDIDNFAFQALLQSPFSVDSFFLLSGFLLAYLFLREACRTNGKINWVYFYLHRLWRLTPVYMLVVGFYMIIFKYLGAGPFWDEHYGDSCRATWWWYLLYISNFIPVNDMCVGWSWYMANDMQFYIISPLFLYVLWRWPKFGIGVILSMIAGSWAITGFLSYTYDLIPMFVGVTKVKPTDLANYQAKMWYSFDMIYDKPYCRISPYLIGVLLGYCLHKIGNRQKFLNVWQQIMGWLLAAFCSGSVVYGLYHSDISKEAGMLYNALCRSSFTLGLAWLIFACETGHGGVISKFLSLKCWIPLSRLTFCAYLVHPILIHGYYQGMQTILYFTQTVMVTNFLGFLLIAYSLAFVVSFTFESPMLNLEKLLLKHAKRH